MHRYERKYLVPNNKLEELRERSHTQVPVIVVSSTASEYATRHEAKDIGAAGFISQPVDPEQLVAEIERCRQEVVPQTSGSRSGGHTLSKEE
jgi:DNA-binding response OmpR family regulator